MFLPSTVDKDYLKLPSMERKIRTPLLLKEVAVILQRTNDMQLINIVVIVVRKKKVAKIVKPEVSGRVGKSSNISQNKRYVVKI